MSVSIPPVNSPPNGSSRRSSNSEEWPSSSSCELGISPSGRIGRVGVREGGGMDILRLGMLNWRLGYKNDKEFLCGCVGLARNVNLRIAM